MRWSQLKLLIEGLFDPELGLAIFCTAQRGEHGASVGHYWLVFKGKTVWDEPRNVAQILKTRDSDATAPKITSILREYLDTPKEELLSKSFPQDHAGLIDILKAADRRVGKRRLIELKASIKTPLALKLIEERLR